MNVRLSLVLHPIDRPTSVLTSDILGSDIGKKLEGPKKP